MKRHLLYNLLTTLCMMITMIMVVCVAGYFLRTPSWSRLLWDLPLMIPAWAVAYVIAYFDGRSSINE